MNTDQQKGYDFAKGVARYLAHCVLWGILLLGAFALLRNSLGWGMDATDRDGWNRSGLRIHVDAETGVEYLSDGKGGLVRRESR